MLAESIKLNVLAPTSKEFIKYDEQIGIPDDDESCHNYANANFLSTAVNISVNKSSILLTSDCQSTVFSNLYHTRKDILNGVVLNIGQCPHHGSIKNHDAEFWKNVNRIPNAKIVFSCGVNTYKHPSYEVVNFFKENSYEIEFTNKVGGLLYEENEIENISIEMNLSSEIVKIPTPTYNLRGDKVLIVK